MYENVALDQDPQMKKFREPTILSYATKSQKMTFTYLPIDGSTRNNVDGRGL